MLVAPSCVIPIEFKVGAKKVDRLDYEQAWAYGLDLKNFHAPSHAAPGRPGGFLPARESLVSRTMIMEVPLIWLSVGDEVYSVDARTGAVFERSVPDRR